MVGNICLQQSKVGSLRENTHALNCVKITVTLTLLYGFERKPSHAYRNFWNEMVYMWQDTPISQKIDCTRLELHIIGLLEDIEIDLFVGAYQRIDDCDFISKRTALKIVRGSVSQTSFSIIRLLEIKRNQSDFDDFFYKCYVHFVILTLSEEKYLIGYFRDITCKLNGIA